MKNIIVNAVKHRQHCRVLKARRVKLRRLAYLAARTRNMRKYGCGGEPEAKLRGIYKIAS